MAGAHEWGGWLALGVTLLLLASRFRHGTPPLPFGMSTWQRWAAHASHIAIYVGLVALAVSGAAAMYGGGRFGVLHVGLTRLGIGLIGLHVSAVCWHQLIRRDQLLSRMWPRH
jgi:cytochrome b561